MPFESTAIKFVELHFLNVAECCSKWQSQFHHHSLSSEFFTLLFQFASSLTLFFIFLAIFFCHVPRNYVLPIWFCSTIDQVCFYHHKCHQPYLSLCHQPYSLFCCPHSDMILKHEHSIFSLAFVSLAPLHFPCQWSSCGYIWMQYCLWWLYWWDYLSWSCHFMYLLLLQTGI